MADVANYHTRHRGGMSIVILDTQQDSISMLWFGYLSHQRISGRPFSVQKMAMSRYSIFVLEASQAGYGICLRIEFNPIISLSHG